MKANEAPEKLYVSNYSSGLTYNWHNERLTVNDIEYIRTDAFIVKAVSWMKEYITNNPNATQIISKKGCVTMGMLINDFKKKIML